MAMHLLPPQQPVVPPLRSLLPAGGSSHCLVFFSQEPPEAGREREEEQEEEQAFLVSLYKFMKERRTPIERVPHLGFKQSACPGCRHGRGAQPGPPFGATPAAASPQGLHTERLPPSRHWPGSGWGQMSVLTGHWAPSTQGAVCPAILVALSGYVLVLCLPVGPWGQAAGCLLLPPRLTAAPPSLVTS